MVSSVYCKKLLLVFFFTTTVNVEVTACAARRRTINLVKSNNFIKIVKTYIFVLLITSPEEYNFIAFIFL